MSNWSWPHPKEEVWRRSQILSAKEPVLLEQEAPLDVYKGNRLSDTGPMQLMVEGMTAAQPKTTALINDPYAEHLLSLAHWQECFTLPAGSHRWESNWPDNDKIVARELCVPAGETVHLKHIESGQSGSWQFRIIKIHLGQGSHFSLESIQDVQGGNALTYWIIEQEAHSRVDWNRIHLGGHFQRDHVQVHQLGERAHTGLCGLYVGNGQQNIESVWHIHHAANTGTSSQLQRGLLTDRAKAVAISGVSVAKNVSGISSKQKLDHILLSETAAIHTRPQLEILADDVKCDHGITVGSMDEDELFYMRSRGIDEGLAKQLLLNGFLSDVWPEELPEGVSDKVASILNAASDGDDA